MLVIISLTQLNIRVGFISCLLGFLSNMALKELLIFLLHVYL